MQPPPASERSAACPRHGRSNEDTFVRSARGRGSASTGGSDPVQGVRRLGHLGTEGAEHAGGMCATGAGARRTGAGHLRAREAGFARALRSASTGEWQCKECGGSASASTGGTEAGARRAGARASASTGGSEASARSVATLARRPLRRPARSSVRTRRGDRSRDRTRARDASDQATFPGERIARRRLDANEARRAEEEHRFGSNTPPLATLAPPPSPPSQLLLRPRSHSPHHRLHPPSERPRGRRVRTPPRAKLPLATVLLLLRYAGTRPPPAEDPPASPPAPPTPLPPPPPPPPLTLLLLRRHLDRALSSRLFLAPRGGRLASLLAPFARVVGGAAHRARGSGRKGILGGPIVRLELGAVEGAAADDVKAVARVPACMGAGRRGRPPPRGARRTLEIHRVVAGEGGARRSTRTAPPDLARCSARRTRRSLVTPT